MSIVINNLENVVSLDAIFIVFLIKTKPNYSLVAMVWLEV